jgi:EAL and modified HD-GYP domain-containing signal transduction protein
MGFSYFQGYFFSKPEVLKDKEIPTSQINLFLLLAEVNKKDVDLERIEQLITRDVSVSYKLLRYINSAYYYLLSEVTSIKHALVYLGESGTRQFVSLVATSELSSNKPDELLRTSIIRARLCELLAGCSDQQHDTSELFLLGLFSLLHAMLDMKMVDIMERLPLTKNIKQALIEQKGPYAMYLETVIAYENGDWKRCQNLLGKLHVSPWEMLSAYLDSVSWSDLFSV